MGTPGNCPRLAGEERNPEGGCSNGHSPEGSGKAGSHEPWPALSPHAASPSSPANSPIPTFHFVASGQPIHSLEHRFASPETKRAAQLQTHRTGGSSIYARASGEQPSPEIRSILFPYC